MIVHYNWKILLAGIVAILGVWAICDFFIYFKYRLIVPLSWETEGNHIIRQFTNSKQPCIMYTVNSPAYVQRIHARADTKINCIRYNFRYVPKNRTHAPNYGKVFWGLKILENNYTGKSIYVDWDVLPNYNLTYLQLLNNNSTNMLLALDSKGITTSWFAFTSKAEKTLKLWMSHTNSPRNYDTEDQIWINAELHNIADYMTVNAYKAIRSHCHNKLTNRNACIKSMFGQGPVLEVSWLLIVLIMVFDTEFIVFVLYYMKCNWLILSWLVHLSMLILWGVIKFMVLYVLIFENPIVSNMGIGETTTCLHDIQSVWNTVTGKPKIPYSRIFLGGVVIETKRTDRMVLVGNGRRLIRCIKVNKYMQLKQHIATMILEVQDNYIVLPLYVVLIIIPIILLSFVVKRKLNATCL